MQAERTRPSMSDSADDAHPLIAFSRSAGLLSQSGNAEAELKTRVSTDVADDLRRLATSVGMTVSEFLRVMVLTRLYGVSGVMRMTQSQIEVVAGAGPEKAHA